jgi:hypothetical protein
MNEDHEWNPGGTHDTLHASAIEVRALSVAFGGLRGVFGRLAGGNACVGACPHPRPYRSDHRA